MPPADHIEVEWQFSALDTRPVARWLESANVSGYTVTPGPTKQLRDRYLDTLGWRLHLGGFTGRIRAKGDSAELTLKSMAAARGGMRSRRELNEAISAPTLESAAAAPGPAGSLLRAFAGRHPLRELFAINTSRRIFLLTDAEGALAEIALDETSIPVGAEDTPVRFSRVEVEVEASAVPRAKPFVDLLAAAGGLTPATTSKFEAALLATGQRPPAAADLGPTAIAAGMSAGEVAFAILRRQLTVLVANEAGTRLGEDIEALHDMRVACRRMRAALAAFAPVVPPALQGIREQLGWLGLALGPVRDLDVQLEQLAEWRSEIPGEGGHALDALETILRSRRDRARRLMLRSLDSRRYDRLIERFSGVLHRGPPRSFGPGRQLILSVAPDLLERRYRRVRKLGDAIRPVSPPVDYHTLRIAAKKLRYALEFVGPIYGKPAIAFSERVTAMQDLLGRHQDADVAIATLLDLANTHRRLTPATFMAMGAITERYTREAARLRRQFPGVYRPIRGGDWRALRKLVEARRPAATPASSR